MLRKKIPIEHVHYIPDNPHSAGGLYLLTKHFYKKDKTRYSDLKMKRIRDRYMKELARQNEFLTCWLCGRNDLQIGLPESHPQVATLDHFIPISMGGEWNDEENFRVACRTCNNHRSMKHPYSLEQDFLKGKSHAKTT